MPSRSFASLSDKKIKPDHVTLAMFYEMKGEGAQSASELELYLEENPKVRNAPELRKLIDTLRAPDTAGSPGLSPQWLASHLKFPYQAGSSQSLLNAKKIAKSYGRPWAGVK